LTLLAERRYGRPTLRAAQLKLSPSLASRGEPAIFQARRSLRAWTATHRDLVLLCIVLALGALLRAAFFLRAPVFIISDSENYFLPGFELARGLGFGLEPRRAPLYPAFIAAVIYGIGQDLASVALVQHALGLLTTGLTYWLGRLAFGRLAGFVAALLVALNGPLLVSEQTIGTEALFTASLALAGALSALALREGRSRLFFTAGVLLALAALVRPVALGLVPILPFVLLASRSDWRRWLRLSALYCAGVALVLLPWMVRNVFALQVFSTEGAFGQTLVGRTVRHDRFVFVDSAVAADTDTRRQRARELMQDAATRGSFITPLRRRLTQELNLTELEANRLMRDLAAEAILRHPGYYALGTARFFVALALGPSESLREVWQTRRDPDAREEWESHPEIAALLGPPNAVQERQFADAERLVALSRPGRFAPFVLALAVVGMAVAAVSRAARPALVPALYGLTLLLVAAAFVGPVPRYRYPAEPFLAVMAGGGLTALCQGAILIFNRVRNARARSTGGQPPS
jgi:4-amino-4-deoxy-L-arabinose transferase-like glycosyltransferase